MAPGKKPAAKPETKKWHGLRVQAERFGDTRLLDLLSSGRDPWGAMAKEYYRLDADPPVDDPQRVKLKSIATSAVFHTELDETAKTAGTPIMETEVIRNWLFRNYFSFALMHGEHQASERRHVRLVHQAWEQEAADDA